LAVQYRDRLEVFQFHSYAPDLNYTKECSRWSSET
jgi:hypothetical protein